VSGTSGSTGSSDPSGATGSTGSSDPSGATGNTGGSDPSGLSGGTGAHDPSGSTGSSDPSGTTGTSSGQPSDPPVNQNNVLGSWDNGFLQGTGGSWGDPGWTDPSLQALIGDLTDLIRDLTSIISSVMGSWTPDGSNVSGMGSPFDGSGQGSVGSLDDGSSHHHHHTWTPGQT
jgi:hypothetical protein